MLKEALLYKKHSGSKVSCLLCAHHCLISDGSFGICRLRQNKGGILYTYAYGSLAAANTDPIEKKPLFHVLPGSSSYSIAAIGCNFRCGFCQNWQISQKNEAEKLGVMAREVEPKQVVTEAMKHQCESISYTYTEPTIFFEYALDIAKLAKKQGLFNIFVTNGFMTKEALELICPYLDAANVDLKFFSDEKYRRVCGGRLQPVLDTIGLMAKFGVWVEVTTLVVPGENDSIDELKGIAAFLSAAGKKIPWHISRFHPDYKATAKAPTPLSKLKEACQIGRQAGLRYVYAGNAAEEEKTCCWKCSRALIGRIGFEVSFNNLDNGKCPYCLAHLDGIFK